MKTLSRRRAALLAALTFALALCARTTAVAQDGEQPRPSAARAELSHEIHLHLLVSAGGAGGGGTRVPASLDSVVRQLKSSLPPADYSLVSTFIHRVRDGGMLEVKSAGGSPFGPTPQNSMTPTFFQIALAGVKLVEDASGQKFVNITPFRLGLKVPIQTATVGSGANAGHPVIQYEDTGITTQLSVREGEPTLVGTLNTSTPGQYFALVLTVKRAGR